MKYANKCLADALLLQMNTRCSYKQAYKAAGFLAEHSQELWA